MRKRAVFLDRDGVLNKTIVRMGKPRAPYSLDELELFDGVEEAAAKLRAHGFTLVIVTNQPDVARGWVGKDIVEAVNESIVRRLSIDDLQVCYHTDKDGCDCRKPKPGMLTAARDKFDIDMARSFMVGDRNSDIEAGKAAGCRTILVGHGEEARGLFTPDYHADSLLIGVEWILQNL